MKAITVIAHVEALPGAEQATEQLLTSLIAPTRNEPGCRAYDLFAKADKPGSYMFIEVWDSREHLGHHVQQSHVQELIGRSHELLAKPLDITIWKKMDGP